MRRLFPANRSDDDRGAVLVEFVIVSTLLITLLFGIVEFGFAWADRLTVQTSTRAGARGGAALGDNRSADYNVIEAVRSAMADLDSANIQYLIVYAAPTADGVIPPSCLGSTPTSQPGKCNVYTGAQLQSLTAADFPGATCLTTHPDRFWCPTTRETRQSVGPSYLGVYVQFKHTYLTGIFGRTTTISDSTVMRLEPKIS